MKRTLPKKWYIKVNKSNLKELGKWRSAGAHGQMRPDNPFPCGYCTSETGFWMSSKPAGFTEITTAEFRKFVLKTPTVKKSPAKFTLPKRWCVQRETFTHETINSWINANLLPGENKYSASDGWIYSERVSRGTNFRSDTDGFSVLTHDKFTPITFEQFKEFVLKETPVKPKTTRRTGPSKVVPIDVKAILPENYVVSVTSKTEEDEVATQLKENEWKGIVRHNYVIWDKNSKGAALYDVIPSKAIGWPILTYAEWKELYYPKPTATTTNKVTIEEIMARPDYTWIRCTTVEQGRKIGEYYYSNGKRTWEDFNFNGLKEFYCYSHCKNHYCGGWNPRIYNSNPVVDFNDVIFPTKAILPIEDFGIVVGKGEAAEILRWFDSYGYNTSGWNGNADVDYVYFVNKDKRVDCTCLKESIKQIFTLTQIKEMTQKTQKIVGYKAPTDLWDGDVKKGEIFILAGKANYCPKDNQIEELYIPKELVETWEPVYEEVIKSKVTNLGTPKRKFTIYKDKVEVVGGDEETRIFSNEQVDAIAKMFTSCTVRSLTTKVNSVQVGCDDGTSLTLGDIEIIKRTQSLL